MSHPLDSVSECIHAVQLATSPPSCAHCARELPRRCIVTGCEGYCEAFNLVCRRCALGRGPMPAPSAPTTLEEHQP